MRLHPEIPLIALLRLTHLRVPLPLAVLRRGRRGDDTRQPKPDKAPHRLNFVEKVLHPRVTQIVEQLHAVHPQHHPKRVGDADRDRLSDKTAQCAPPAGPMEPARPSCRETTPAASAASSCRAPTPKSSPVPYPRPPSRYQSDYHNSINLFRPSLGAGRQGVDSGRISWLPGRSSALRQFPA